MESDAPGAAVPPDWTAARSVARLRRDQRLHPERGSAQRHRRVGATVIALWVLAFVLALIGLLTHGRAGEVLGLITYVFLAAYATVAFIWGSSSGRQMFRGSTAGIRNALPSGSWRSVKQQLAGRIPIDAEHQDVVLELAHQQRGLIEGQLAFAGFYVVLYLGIAHSSDGWLRSATLVFGIALLTGGLVTGARSYRRLGRLIRSTSD